MPPKIPPDQGYGGRLTENALQGAGLTLLFRRNLTVQGLGFRVKSFMNAAMRPSVFSDDLRGFDVFFQDLKDWIYVCGFYAYCPYCGTAAIVLAGF